MNSHKLCVHGKHNCVYCAVVADTQAMSLVHRELHEAVHSLVEGLHKRPIVEESMSKEIAEVAYWLRVMERTCDPTKISETISRVLEQTGESVLRATDPRERTAQKCPPR